MKKTDLMCFTLVDVRLLFMLFLLIGMVSRGMALERIQHWEWMEKGDAAFVDLNVAGVNVGHAGIFIGDNSRTRGRKYVYAKGYTNFPFSIPFPVVTGGDDEFRGVGGDGSNFWHSQSLACLTWYQRNNIVYAALAQRGVRYPVYPDDMSRGSFKKPYGSFDWSHSADPYYFLMNTQPRQPIYDEVMRCDGLVECAYEMGMNNDGFFSTSYESAYKAKCLAYTFLGIPLINQIIGYYNLSSAISPVSLYERMSSWEGRIPSPPSVIDINIGDGARISSQTRISCTISDTDYGSGVEKARFTWDQWGNVDVPSSSPNYIGLDNHQENVSGTYSATWNTLYASNGQHLLYIEVWDQAGNWALYKQPVTVYNSSSPPPQDIPPLAQHNPYAPTPIASQLSPNSVCLNWINNGDPDNDPVTFSCQILRSDGSQAWITPFDWTETNSGWRDLPAGSYTWRVKSDDGALQSNWVWGTPFTIGGAATPTVNITEATVSGLNVHLTWTSSNVAYTRLYRYDNGDLSNYAYRWGFNPASEISKDVEVPIAGTYQYKLKGYDSAYQEICSSNLRPVVIGSSVTITGASITGLNVRLTWAYSNATYVRLYRYDNGDLSTWGARYGFNPANQGAKDITVPVTGTYIYKLKAYDSTYNLLGESNLYTVNVGSSSLAITSSSVNAFNVTINWSYDNATYIRIYRYDDADTTSYDWRSGFHLASERTFTNVVPIPNTYIYKLKAYDSNYNLLGESNLYTVVVGPPVRITDAIVNGLGITINWAYSAPITQVRIYEYRFGVGGYIWRSGMNPASNRSKDIWVPEPGVYTIKIKGYDSNTVLVGESDLFTVIVGNFTFQPDLMLRLPNEGIDSGDNVYDTLIGQTKTQIISAGATATYLVKLQNDGTTADCFLVTGSATASNSGWTVRYFDAITDGANITDAITDTGWLVPALGVGATQIFRVEVTPGAAQPPSDVFTVDVTAVSQADTAKSDSVEMVTTVNTPPLAIEQRVQTNKGIGIPITLTGSDADGDTLTYSVVTTPSHGILTGTAPSLTYTPTEGYVDTDSLTFKVNDGSVDSETVTVSITITNSPPMVYTYNVMTDVNITRPIILIGNDVNDDELTYTVVVAPEHGVLTGTAPNLTYSPDLNFTGTDFIAYKANDGQADSNISTVSITVLSTQPDLWVRALGDASYTGSNIYSTNGATQQRSLSVVRGTTATYYLHVQNDGSAADSFTIKSEAAPAGWTVKYYTFTGVEVTAEVTSVSGWSTGMLAVGAVDVGLYVKVTPSTSVAIGTKLSLTPSATSLTDGSNIDVGRLVTTATGWQPDLWVRARGDASYTGNNLYSNNGASQNRALSVARGATVIYYMHLQNDGSAPDTFTVKSAAAPSGWTVKYYTFAGVEVTAEVTGVSGWSTGMLAVGVMDGGLYVKVTPTNSVKLGAKLTLTPRATSLASRSSIDVGKLVTTAIGYQPDLWVRALNDASYTGNNLYSTDGVTQNRALNIAIGATATYYLRVQNDGSAADTFTLKSAVSPPGWTVKYYTFAGVEVTADVTGASGWSTGQLTVGAVGVGIYVKVTPTSLVTIGDNLTLIPKATSLANNSNIDVGKLVTTTGF